MTLHASQNTVATTLLAEKLALAFLGARLPEETHGLD